MNRGTAGTALSRLTFLWTSCQEHTLRNLNDALPFISRPSPGATAWVKFSLTLVKVTKLSLLWASAIKTAERRPLCKLTYKIHILVCAGKCLTTNSLGRKMSWFVALVDFHGVSSSNPGQFHDSYILTSLYLEVEREGVRSAFQYKCFHQGDMLLQLVHLLW